MVKLVPLLLVAAGSAGIVATLVWPDQTSQNGLGDSLGCPYLDALEDADEESGSEIHAVGPSVTPPPGARRQARGPFSPKGGVDDSAAAPADAAVEGLGAEDNYGWFRPSADGLRDVSMEELSNGNGESGNPLLLAIDGFVFDVSDESRFYAPGKAYHALVARDSTRALALTSLDEDELARGGDVSDFTEEQRALLAERVDYYASKYPIIGRIADLGADNDL